ncbi:hypothetical protein M378DRAFT_178576 [Amanita muscaria Koide BX008]|uniref:G domain-containing protein n=1 Tax=Amanita muscaria (strain Koide BX008) TaxID=946122 RepID=A0A0C2TE12_AMAMK|nr:hypothetical protein M378DRAFT_178576 [Amanita muscaria Koide BX008]
MANDRVVETGVKEIFNMVQGRIPAIVVFTKYDKLATVALGEAGDDIDGFSDEEVWRYMKNKAKEAAETLCICPWRKEVGKAPLMVSIHEEFEEIIQELIKATDEEIQQQSGIHSHTEPRALNFAAAQRMNSGIKIDASVGIGKLSMYAHFVDVVLVFVHDHIYSEHWSKLLPKTDFTGKQLRQCLDVIHRDIVLVWNIRNSSVGPVSPHTYGTDRYWSQYLAGDDFKVKMSVLVDDLVANPDTPTPSDGLRVATVAALASAASSPAGIVILVVGSAVLIAKWLFDVYQNTSHNIACVMAYIVDLTILMHRLSEVEISEERVISTLQDYARSEEIAQVHNDIRVFSGRMLSLSLEGNDAALTEIIRLIEKHRVRSGSTEHR